MTHRLLWHPHVIKLYKVFLTQTHLAVVLEYAGASRVIGAHPCTPRTDCGDMYDSVSKRGRLSESSARWIFQQLMVAVDYLHQMVRQAPSCTANHQHPTEHGES